MTNKTFILLFTLSFYFNVIFAKNISQEGNVPKIVFCLGQEEAYYHKKQIQNMHYKLNQWLIAELVNYSSISIQNNLLNQICDSKKITKSLTLMGKFIINPETTFTSSISKKEDPKLKALIVALKKIFFDLIIDSQNYAKSITCYKEKFPETKFIFDQIKYTEEIYNLVNLIDQIKSKENLVAKLFQVPQIFNSCTK